MLIVPEILHKVIWPVQKNFNNWLYLMIEKAYFALIFKILNV